MDIEEGTQEETPFYIRTTDGECFHVNTLDEAIEAFTNDKGYRLTLFASNGDQVVIRRSTYNDADMLGNPEAEAVVTFRKEVELPKVELKLVPND